MNSSRCPPRPDRHPDLARCLLAVYSLFSPNHLLPMNTTDSGAVRLYRRRLRVRVPAPLPMWPEHLRSHRATGWWRKPFAPTFEAMAETSDSARTNIDGLRTSTVAHVIHYGKRTFTLDHAQGNQTLAQIRALLREGSSDVVAVAHKDGLSWLAVGPGVPIVIDEIAPVDGQSDRKALKAVGLA